MNIYLNLLIAKSEAKCYLRWANSNLGKVNLRYGKRFCCCCNRILRPVKNSLRSEIAGDRYRSYNNYKPEQFLSFTLTGRNIGQATYRGGLKELSNSLHPE